MKNTALPIALLAFAIPAWGDIAVDETKAAAPDGEIEIYNVSGTVTITGWERDEIRVYGTIGDDVEELVFDVDDDDAEIRVKLPKNKRGNIDGSARLKISVPSGSTLDVQTVSAPITIRGVYGDEIQAEAISGNITIEDCRGDVETDVVSGAILVDGDHASVSAETVSGDVEVRGVTTEFNGETVSGGVAIVAGALQECDIEVLSGRVRFEGSLRPGGEMNVEAFSGSVDIVFTEEVFGQYDIETMNGRIDNGFGPEPRKKSRYGPGYELRFDHGDGDARVHITSFSGRISLNHR